MTGSLYLQHFLKCIVTGPIVQLNFYLTIFTVCICSRNAVADAYCSSTSYILILHVERRLQTAHEIDFFNYFFLN